MIRTVQLAALVAVSLLVVGLAHAGGDKVLSKEDFVAKVLDCNVTEMDLAEKAVKNAQSADVRKYAEKLVKDHRGLKEKAEAVAKELKIGVVTGTSPEHKEALLKLTTAKGAEFDRAFVGYMVKSHEKAVTMLEANAKGSTSQEVRKMATGALPTIRAHLEEARKLDKSLNK